MANEDVKAMFVSKLVKDKNRFTVDCYQFDLNSCHHLALHTSANGAFVFRGYIEFDYHL